MADIDILMRLALALSIGLLLGLERGWHDRAAPEGARTAGIRTFALTGLFGGICGWLAQGVLPIVPAAGLLAIAVLLAAGYRAKLARDADLGLTTEIALMLTFVLGVAATLTAMAPAAAAAVLAAVLLSLKPRLHGLIARIEHLELEALLKLALISVVILPLLPDRGFGPGAVLNPYELWWAVVIVAGLSFVGYLAIRLLGIGAGVLATGFFGGLASSTSTTLALSRLMRGEGAPTSLVAAGILLSGSVTFLRILVLLVVFAPGLIVPLAAPMICMAATGLVGAGVHYRQSASAATATGEAAGIANPLALRSAMVFGMILGIVVLAVHYLGGAFGAGGVYTAAALSGLSDVDALTISVARLIGAGLTLDEGAIAIFIAASVNTAVKALIALLAGNGGLGRKVGAVYLLVILAGGAALVAGPPFGG